MSDGISRIELKAAAYSRYSEEREDSGLLRTAPDLGDGAAALRSGNDGGAAARKAYDDDGLLPVMLENRLEKIGVL